MVASKAGPISAPSQSARPRTLRARHVVVAATGGVALASILRFQVQRPSPLKKARQELVTELSAAQPAKARVDELVDQLLLSNEPFNEALIGGGPWQVVYSRGALPWQQWTAPGSLLGGGKNKASQEFDPKGRRVVNRGQVLGDAVRVTAEGTYEPMPEGAEVVPAKRTLFGKEEGPRVPQLIKANIEKGTLHAWGWDIPLPIRGSGLVYLAYCDDSLRVFKGTNGAVTVQIREDRLAGLLKG